jgi:hypothetical protein
METNLDWSSISQWKDEQVQLIKPWGEFSDVSRFSKPAGSTALQLRLQQNIKYYQSNYFIVLLVILAFLLWFTFKPDSAMSFFCSACLLFWLDICCCQSLLQ